MEEQIEELEPQAAVSEQAEGELQDQEKQESVPLSAMIATRKRAQEAESRAQSAEVRAQTLEAILNKLQSGKSEPEEIEDPQGLVEKKDLYANTALTKREILESVFADNRPEDVLKINKYLKPILEKKPWLAQSVDTALNRYARANEIVNDYMHLVEEKTPERKSASSDAKRIVENAHKPRSPTEVGKSARPHGAEYLKSIQGSKEFREYRQKVLRGET